MGKRKRFKSFIATALAVAMLLPCLATVPVEAAQSKSDKVYRKYKVGKLVSATLLDGFVEDVFDGDGVSAPIEAYEEVYRRITGDMLEQIYEGINRYYKDEENLIRNLLKTFSYRVVVRNNGKTAKENQDILNNKSTDWSLQSFFRETMSTSGREFDVSVVTPNNNGNVDNSRFVMDDQSYYKEKDGIFTYSTTVNFHYSHKYTIDIYGNLGIVKSKQYKCRDNSRIHHIAPAAPYGTKFVKWFGPGITNAKLSNPIECREQYITATGHASYELFYMYIPLKDIKKEGYIKFKDGRYLCIKNNSKLVGAKAYAQTKKTNSSTFVFEKVGDAYYIKNKYSGLYLRADSSNYISQAKKANATKFIFEVGNEKFSRTGDKRLRCKGDISSYMECKSGGTVMMEVSDFNTLKDNQRFTIQ